MPSATFVVLICTLEKSWAGMNAGHASKAAWTRKSTYLLK
jgi:hypothetical protein